MTRKKERMKERKGDRKREITMQVSSRTVPSDGALKLLTAHAVVPYPTQEIVRTDISCTFAGGS